jgi:uncharacterized protein (DUF983 family)
MVRLRQRWDGAPLQPRVVRTCLRRALHHACPQCGRGALFARWARLSERCAVCGLIYRRDPGAELSAMTLSCLVNSALSSVLFLSLALATDWGAVVGFSIGAPAALGMSYALAPLCMAVAVAVDYLGDVWGGEWWAHPRT